LKVGLSAIFILVGLLRAQVAPPQLRCLATNSVGDITLHWIPPADPGGLFSSYEVFYATAKNGPYSNVGSIAAITSTAFTHTGAGGNLQSRYYFVLTKFGPGGTSESIPSDTLRSIFLNLINPPGIVGLNYNQLKQPALPSSSSSFSLLREYPVGTWTNFHSASTLNYNDTITICNASYNYVVTLSDNSGCVSTSNISGGLYKDKFGPIRIDIDSVSVMPNGQTVIGYPPTISGDGAGYYVYQVINGINTKIDSLPGKNNTLYTFTTAAATGTTVEFIVAPFDSCGNVGLLNNAHQTMYLKHVYDRCNYKTSLSWNAYQNLKGGVLEYRIYYSVNGGVPQIAGTTTQTEFTHQQVDPDKNITYFVRVVNVPKTITASSNRVSFFSYQSPAPNFIYLRSASVMNDERISLKFFADSVNMASGFDIYRSSDGVNFSKIIFIGATGNGNYEFTDAGVQANERSYYYRAVAKDSCGNDRTMSNTAQTMLLKVQSDKQFMFRKNLSWNHYSGFNAGNAGYAVYRAVDDQAFGSPLAYTGAGENSYEDNIENLASEGAKVVYKVEAIEALGNVFGILETATSNTATAYAEADVFVPTAFAPKGLNKVWKPVTHFADKSEYNLKIFSRWGNLLFETNDTEQGWDGGGSPNDVYVYLIQFKNSRGEYIELKGNFTLL
jgi:gliding motility-associated-like protein